MRYLAPSLRLALCCALAMPLATQGAAAQGTLDQSNTPTWTGGAVNISPVNNVSQSFKPSLPCLVGVEAALMTGNKGRGDDTLTLSLLGESPNQVLGSNSETVHEGFDGYQRFNFSPPLLVTPGKQFTFRLSDTKVVFFWKYAGNNPYPSGQAYFYGAAFGSNDFLFRSYGSQIGNFGLSLSPDPLTLNRSGQGDLLIATPPDNGTCTGPVSVTISGLPNGVTAQPASLTIANGSGKTTLKATEGASIGTFKPTVTAAANGQSKSKNFTLIVAQPPPPAPRVTQISPALQLPGQAITITGTGFDASCVDVINFGTGSTAAPNGTCSQTSLKVIVPANLPYGATVPVTVKTSGGLSNAINLEIARQQGDFVELSSNILAKRVDQTCSGGTAKLTVATGTGTTFKATYQSNQKTVGPITFDSTWHYSSGSTPMSDDFGGAGFSQCNVGIIIDASVPQLMFYDLDSGKAFVSSPYKIAMAVPHLTPPFSENYHPRLFSSPDGTIILAVSATNSSTPLAFLTAAFFDKANSGKQLPLVTLTGKSGTTGVGQISISASVTGTNQVRLTFDNMPSQSISIP